MKNILHEVFLGEIGNQICHIVDIQNNRNQSTSFEIILKKLRILD